MRYADCSALGRRAIRVSASAAWRERRTSPRGTSAFWKPATSFTTPSSLLRKALLADTVLSGLTGLLLVLAAGPLAAPLGLPVGMLRWSGIILIPFAAFVARVRAQERIQRPLVFAIVACNALWALDSVLLLFTGWIEPTLPGEVFVAGQAIVVAMLAELEFVGLRRSTGVEARARH